MSSPAPSRSARRSAAIDLSEHRGVRGERNADALPARVRERAKLHMLDVIGTALAATQFDFSHRALAGLRRGGRAGQAHGHRDAGEAPAARCGAAERHPRARPRLRRHASRCDRASEQQRVSLCARGRGEDRRERRRPDRRYTCWASTSRLASASPRRARCTPSGFHTTGIAGHFGCVIAAGKLLGLTEDQLVMAQGLAGSTSSAVSEHRADGAWNKRMHPGWAGVGGITAALLARGGFIGTKKIYEGADGLFRSHTGARFAEVDLRRADARPRRQMADRRSRDQAFPDLPSPACVRRLRDRAAAQARSRNPRDIAKVRALLHPETFHYVAEPAEMRRRPVSDYMAKFSVQFVVAACLIRGKFGFAELERRSAQGPADPRARAARLARSRSAVAVPEIFLRRRRGDDEATAASSCTWRK